MRRWPGVRRVAALTLLAGFILALALGFDGKTATAMTRQVVTTKPPSSSSSAPPSSAPASTAPTTAPRVTGTTLPVPSTRPKVTAPTKARVVPAAPNTVPRTRYQAPTSPPPTTPAPPATTTTILGIGGRLPAAPVTLPLRTTSSNGHVSPAFAWLSGAGFSLALVIVAYRLYVTRPGAKDRAPLT